MLRRRTSILKDAFQLGYDASRFQSRVDDALKCCICFGVLNKPLQCEKNEHHFCEGCIKEHLQKSSQTCPVCRDRLTAARLCQPSRIITNFLARLKIKCDHAHRGCDAVVELEALRSHALECAFMPVACSNEGCPTSDINKGDIKKHKEICRFRKISCADCRKHMPFHKYGSHGCSLKRRVNKMTKEIAELKQKQYQQEEIIQNLKKEVRNAKMSSEFCAKRHIYI